MVSRALDMHGICVLWLWARMVLVPSVHEAFSYTFFRLFFFIHFFLIVFFFIWWAQVYDFLSCFERSKLIATSYFYLLHTQYIVHEMGFLSYEQTLFFLTLTFFNFIRMHFDFPTKTDCFLTVKTNNITPLGHKSFGRRQLKFTYVPPVTNENPKKLRK